MNKRKRFNQIAKDIKTIKIQGARNIAKKALYAYSLIPTKTSKKILFRQRNNQTIKKTDPNLRNLRRRNCTCKNNY